MSESFCRRVAGKLTGLSLWTLGLAAPLVLGCAARTPVVAPPVAQEPLPRPEPRPYRLQPGDAITVSFWGDRELDQDVVVRPDGMISLPFVDEVRAAGLTPAELDGELTERYTGELAKPEITIIVRELSGQRVFVGGEVGEQGALPLTSGLTLLQAIQERGGFLTSARRRQVLLIRTGSDGTRLARSIDLRPVLSGADPNADVALQPWDIVFVPRTKITNVDLFVEQYINRALPFQPQIYLPLVNDPIFGGDENGDNPAEEGGGGGG